MDCGLAWFLNRSLPPRAAPSFEEPAGRAPEPCERPATEATEDEAKEPWLCSRILKLRPLA